MGRMKIEILGSGCARCKALTERIEQTVKRVGVDAEIIKVGDIADIARRGILSTPGLAIDGVMKSVGTLPSVEQIEKWIKG
jgi:small redox-active disulfide protein 2